MAKYLAMRIKDGALDYDTVIAKYPQYKDEIDAILAENGQAKSGKDGDQ